MLSRPDHTWHGAAIMWHDTLHSDVQAIPNTHDRFTGIKVNFGGHSVLAISAYLPTSGKDDEMLDCLDELSNYITANKKNVDTTVIGMDSNCSMKSSSRRQKSFQLFCEENDLLKFCHVEPTFHHNNGSSSSNIDYFLITANNITRTDTISLQCNKEYPQNLSSHDPVIGNILVQHTPQTTKQGLYKHTYTDFDQNRIIWRDEKVAEYQTLANKALSEYEAWFPTPDFIPLKCQLFSELLVKTAEICFDIRPSTTSRRPNHVQDCIRHGNISRDVIKSGKMVENPDLVITDFL